MFEVTLLPIIVAAVANVVIGMIWYNPRVFGTAWMNAAGLDASRMAAGRSRMPIMAGIAFVAAMLMAYVLNHFGIAWGVFDWIGGIDLGFWVWLGFIVPVLLGPVLWEMKPLKYFAINAGYWLLMFVTTGVILVSMAA